ncbi:MAG: hypothetical protein JXQ72_17810, partial [Anaerolineae bacterium]|nr:hypothetical protein [Anaerolineae bacterium]
FWFLGSLGILHNTPGGMVFAWSVVLVAGLVAFFRWRDRPSLREWFREHRALVITTELLFLVLLFGWAIFRAHNPEMRSTEKPMEIMFINGIRASDVFPPHDSWLAGYAISYYYFGYVIVAMLADLSGVSSGIAFNITIALLFALAGIGALGVVYNLVRARIPGGRWRSGGARAAIGAGLLGACLLILTGNLGTALVEFPYQGWTPGLVDEHYFDFWDVEGRGGAMEALDEAGNTILVPLDSDGDGIPNWDEDRLPLKDWSFTWGVGWRYSRTVQDRDLNGTPVGAQPITEFPNFSFVLADIHPHVLALPFALLAIGLALNLVLNGRELTYWEFPFYAVWVGGMVFMNSWDAIYIPFLIGADALRRLIRRGDGTLSLEDLLGTLRFAAILVALTLLLYFPWIISFTSQANGVLPNVIYPTAWQQFFLQFGMFLVILAWFLLVEIRRAHIPKPDLENEDDDLNDRREQPRPTRRVVRTHFHWQAGLLAFTCTVSLAVLLVAVLGVSAWNKSDTRYPVFAVFDPSVGLGSLVDDILARRLEGLPSELLMFGFVFVVIGRLFARRPTIPVTETELIDRELGRDYVVRVRAIDYSPATGFALLLIGAGAVLTIAPDFIYLRDNFAVRINTVFKLYYQGWIMFSLAAGFGVWSVLAGEPEAVRQRKRKPKPRPLNLDRWVEEAAFSMIVLVFVAAGLLYPLTAMHGRALRDPVENYVPGGRQSTQERVEACDPLTFGGICPELPPLTLDGTPFMIAAEEYAAVRCLDDLESDPGAVLLEAPCHCGYRPDIGRFSALTGIPTLMGWGNHEGQWRGPTLSEVTDTRMVNGQRRDRFTDAEEIYSTLDWNRTWALIDRYGIDYIVVGSAERAWIAELAGGDTSKQASYQQGLDKFAQILQPVCQAGTITVYRVGQE